MECREFENSITPALVFSKKVKEYFPAVIQKNSYTLFAEMREIKEQYEIDLIQKIGRAHV